MQPYVYNGGQGNLRPEPKRDWMKSNTARTMLFIHGGAAPHQVVANGLSPAFAREYLVHDGGPNHGQPISGGKMLFAFFACAGDQPPANVPLEKPAGVGPLWGFDGHSYVFRVPRNTEYWSKDGLINVGSEVAFEYVFESADIVSYWAPSGNYVMAPGQARVPRRNFQRVSWNAYLASRAAAMAAI